LPVVAQTDEPRRGTVLSGKYELHSVLGKGGMGVVYRGKHLGTDRPIAVKVLRRELMADATLAKRFMREAKAAAVMQHPNVVDVLDYGVEPDGTAFQVLELLEGESLGEHLARKGKIPIDVVLSLLLPVIHALAAAHARGVVHRDLKPDNVFLARNAHGRIVPKLLDFGVAKLMPAHGGPSSTLSTRAGSAIGTPAYMSPEQARGTADVGTPTDIWAIGVILFECVAGEVPFDAETGSILMARIIMEQARSLATVAPETPPAIVAVIDRALTSKQEDRWPTMAALAEALRAAATESGIAVPAVGASDTAAMSLPPPRRELEEIEVPSSDPGESGGEGAHVHPSTRGARGGLSSVMTRDQSAEAQPTPVTTEVYAPGPGPSSRAPLVSVLAVSVVALALVLLGMWLREPTVGAGPSAAPPAFARPAEAPLPVQIIEAEATEVVPAVEMQAVEVPAVAVPAAEVPAAQVTAPEVPVVEARREPRERARRTPTVPAPEPEPPSSQPGHLPDLTGW
jgi:eukaryotic-like serine/threonine-protein kinase